MLQSDNHGVPGVPQVLFIMDDDDGNKLSAKSVKLGAFPTRAQIDVLRQNRSFLEPPRFQIPSKFPKITSISSFAFLAFEYPEMMARNFKVSI